MEIRTNDLKVFLASSVYMRKMAGRNPNEGYEYCCMEDFVLRNGAPFDEAVKPTKYRYGTPRYCFENTYNLVKRHKNLVYVEGYAVSVIPTLHAWAIEPGCSNVIDITWRSEGHLYFGVPFNRDYLLAWHRRQGKKKHSSMSLLDNWHESWPLLTGKEVGWKYEQA